jgi:hypothetical protein
VRARRHAEAVLGLQAGLRAGYSAQAGADTVDRAVFAHYMVNHSRMMYLNLTKNSQVGNVYEEHAHKDIDSAAAIGLGGFALNIGDPAQPFVRQTMNYMFDYARDNHSYFKLFISMDLWASK